MQLALYCIGGGSAMSVLTLLFVKRPLRRGQRQLIHAASYGGRGIIYYEIYAEFEAHLLKILGMQGLWRKGIA
jgi:hypothetical protein